MTHLLFFSSMWLLIATLAAMTSHWLKLAGAISEIILGAFFGYVLLQFFGYKVLDPNEQVIKFIGMAGAIFLTFLAGIELNPEQLKKHWKEASSIGVTSFFVPFIICFLIIFYLFHWSKFASLIGAISLSTTSVAVIYTVLLELKINESDFGKKLLIACFVTDLITVIMLTIMFASYSFHSLIFIFVFILSLIVLPYVIKKTFKEFGKNTNEFETKFILFVLFGMSAYASFVKIEAVLPAYLIGVTLAETLGNNENLIKRFRTLTFGLLTPFYFISVGLLVSLSSIVHSFFIIIILLFLKIFAKSIGIYPVATYFKPNKVEAIYSILLMSTGLTFGSIAALSGLDQGILDATQYSVLIAVVVGSAIFPTICAYIFFKINARNKVTLNKNIL